MLSDRGANSFGGRIAMGINVTQRCASLVSCLALGFGFSVNPAVAGPIYSEVAVIPVPSIQSINPTGAFSFDISFFDANTQRDYVADRSNASIDIFSAATNSFLGRIDGTGSNAFVGSVGSPDTGPN